MQFRKAMTRLLRRHYATVDARELTMEDLRSCTLPSEYLQIIRARVNDSGKTVCTPRYDLQWEYSGRGPGKPHLSVKSFYYEDVEPFEATISFICGSVKGEAQPTQKIFGRDVVSEVVRSHPVHRQLECRILLENPFTLSDAADVLETFTPLFGKGAISDIGAQFRTIPRYLCKSPGIQKSKLYVPSTATTTSWRPV